MSSDRGKKLVKKKLVKVSGGNGKKRKQRVAAGGNGKKRKRTKVV